MVPVCILYLWFYVSLYKNISVLLSHENLNIGKYFDSLVLLFLAPKYVNMRLILKKKLHVSKNNFKLGYGYRVVNSYRVTELF